MLSKKGRHTGTIFEFVAWKAVHNFRRDSLVKINVQWNLSNPDTLHDPWGHFRCPLYRGILISGVIY